MQIKDLFEIWIKDVSEICIKDAFEIWIEDVS
jgi:hypothetical protein